MALIPTLWHNPRCSTSRRALDLVRSRGIEPAIRPYLTAPAGVAELADLCRRLGLRPFDLVRTGEADWAATGLGPQSPDAAVLDALAAYTRLLQRPILVLGDHAVIGRPPERVLTLI